MNKDSFIIQDVQPRTDSVKYVVLQAGRGKSKRSSIYVSSFAFSYLEGLIWNKYREYSDQKKLKISKNEWVRIIDGINVAITDIEKNNNKDIKSALKFTISKPKFKVSIIEDKLEDFIAFVKEFVDWVLTKTQTESNITIMKKNY